MITVGQCDNFKKYHIHDTSDNGCKTLCKKIAFGCEPIDWVNKEDVCKLCLSIQRKRYGIPIKDDTGCIELRRKEIDKCDSCNVAVRINKETCNQHIKIARVDDNYAIKWFYYCVDCADEKGYQSLIL
jgi:hypothetical protein